MEEEFTLDSLCNDFESLLEDDHPHVFQELGIALAQHWEKKSYIPEKEKETFRSIQKYFLNPSTIKPRVSFGFLDERNSYWIHKLENQNHISEICSKSIFMIMGSAHVDGIEKKLKESKFKNFEIKLLFIERLSQLSSDFLSKFANEIKTSDPQTFIVQIENLISNYSLDY